MEIMNNRRRTCFSGTKALNCGIPRGYIFQKNYFSFPLFKIFFFAELGKTNNCKGKINTFLDKSIEKSETSCGFMLNFFLLHPKSLKISLFNIIKIETSQFLITFTNPENNNLRSLTPKKGKMATVHPFLDVFLLTKTGYCMQNVCSYLNFQDFIYLDIEGITMKTP